MCTQEFGLSRGEKLQFANLHPTAPVDVHLVRYVSSMLDIDASQRFVAELNG